MPSQNGRLSSKFYCVTRGHIAGVFTDYAVVQQQLERFSGNSFQSVKGHISDARAYMLKLGTACWQDHAEQTAGNWDQSAQHAGYIAARDEFWEDPHYHSVAVDVEKNTSSSRGPGPIPGSELFPRSSVSLRRTPGSQRCRLCTPSCFAIWCF